MQGYTAKDVAKMLDISVGQVRTLARAGFIEPKRGPQGEYRFSFQDLVLLRTARGLTASSIPPRRLRNALRKLRRQLPSGHPLSAVQIEARGEELVVRQGGAVWNPESGQAQLNFEVAELVRKAAPHARQALEQARLAEEELDADDWYELGFDLESAAPEQATEAYKHAIEQQPHHVDARLNLGRLYLMAGRANAAEAQFRVALAGGTRDATALFNLGVALEDLGRESEAMQAYREAIVADESCVDAYFNLARLYEKAGDSPAALRYLKSYRQLMKEN